MPGIVDDYGKDHAFTCPHCGLRWRTSETGPKLHCKKCNRWFPNPWAVPAPEKENH
jgi:NADH pyrophosphatase NudC (nudix superfamily)